MSLATLDHFPSYSSSLNRPYEGKKVYSKKQQSKSQRMSRQALTFNLLAKRHPERFNALLATAKLKGAKRPDLAARNAMRHEFPVEYFALMNDRRLRDIEA